MISPTEEKGRGREQPAPASRGVTEKYPISTTAPWLLAAKVTAPARTPFFFDRPELIERIERTEWSTIVVRAPGGFGKTTLLSEVCRRARERGMLAAWLTLDEDDTEDAVGLYLMHAFERAGLDLVVARDAVEYRMELLALQIRKHGAPCLLVIDEVERLAGHAIGALDFFLHHAPGNLRIVLGLREDPGLDLASAILDGRGTVLTVDQLRFSRSEIAAYFHGGLSRRELAAVAERTEGWAVAVCLYRNIRLQEAGTGRGGKPLRNLAGDEGVAANWLGARLLRSVTDDDRDFLLDLALFDWVDPAIVDEVLNSHDSGRRMLALTALEGLMQPLDSGQDTRRLHPLLKEYCSAEREFEDPQRFRQLHRKIALAMFKRGYLLPAVRHAGISGDVELVGSILVQAGGLRLWLREGMTQLGTAERFLTQDVVSSFPRLALLRCRLLMHRSSLVEARTLYETTRARTDDFARDREGGDDSALRAEGMIIQAALVGYGCLPYSDALVDNLAASLDQVKSEDEPDPATVAVHAALLFAAHNLRARFERAYEFGEEAEAQYALCDSQYGGFHMGLHAGNVAMAQGQVAEAEQRYARAAQIAEQHFPLDSALREAANILLTELHLEQNRLEAVQQQIPAIPVPLRNSAAWLDIYAAAHEVAAEWRYETGSVEDALLSIESSREFADSEGLVSVARHLSALRIGYLVTAGRMEDAERGWLDAGLPEDPTGLLDLDRQSWREMESISCARLRLLTAVGRLEESRSLADRLAAVARERGLLRTLMRCLVLWMVLEYEAGEIGAAIERLVEFLRLLPGAGLSRPLARERETSRAMLQRLLETDLEPEIRESADAMLRQLGDEGGARTPHYTVREREILVCLGRGHRDKEIARRLSLTVDGVRYHLKNIYRKSGASGRLDAVQRARAAGVIS